MVWVPVKEASVPSLVPPGQLERVNLLMLITGYGLSPVPAAAMLAAANRFTRIGPLAATDFALYSDALTFPASASVVLFGAPRRSAGRSRRGRAGVLPPTAFPSRTRRGAHTAEPCAGSRHQRQATTTTRVTKKMMASLMPGAVVPARRKPAVVTSAWSGP
jgi:hypothetical protein